MADVPDNQVVGQRIQERFEFYLVALTFTLLGLAVQTASFGSVIVADTAELGAWALLLSSGLSGIKRIEGLPNIYRLFSLKNQQTTNRTAFAKHQAQAMGGPVLFLESGEELPVEDAIARAEANIEKIDERLAEMQGQSATVRSTQRKQFARGMALLIGARAVPAVTGIAERLPNLVR